MNIQINSYQNFKSKSSPIMPFIIKTKHGRLKVCEVTSRDLKREGFYENITKLFCKNFASMTEDPNLQIFKKPNHVDYESSLKNFTKYYRSKIENKNEDLTLLIAKDKRNNIQGACLAYGYDRIPGVKNTVYYIDSIAVNKSYRHFNVGKILINKTLESVKNKFSDAFLAGDKNAYRFYEKMGFNPLDKNNSFHKNIIEYISRCRTDYPKYIELFTKALNEEKERWFMILPNIH